MKKRTNYCFHFEKFRKRSLKVWESRIIEPMEIQRQRTGMIRAIVHDPQIANGWPPAYAKVRLLLIDYFRFLSHLGDKWMTDLVMDADKQMARRVVYHFKKGTIAASGRCPDSVRGLTFHRALILDTCFYPHHKVEEGLDPHIKAVFSAVPLIKGTVVIIHGNANLGGAFAEHYYTALYDPDMTALRPVSPHLKSPFEIPLNLKPPLSHHPPASPYRLQTINYQRIVGALYIAPAPTESNFLAPNEGYYPPIRAVA